MERQSSFSNSMSKEKRDSLERLTQQLYQASVENNTILIRQLKAIIERIKSLDKGR